MQRSSWLLGPVVLGLLWCLSMGGGLAAAQPATPDPCAAQPAKQQLACFMQQYTAADRTLNAEYKRLTAKLDAARQQDMRTDSRQWIAYKESLCTEIVGRQEQLEPAQVKKSAPYYGCLRDLTVARTTYLQRAFGHEGVAQGIPGEYDDGVGGTLTLTPSTGDTMAFHIDVVRGGTYHVGTVEGTVRLQGQVSTFVQRQECGGAQPCCKLTFTRTPYIMTIDEESCEHLRGVRAYFAGKYRKVK